MNPVVLVGIRYGEPHRDRNWSFNRQNWELLDWPIHEGVYDDPGPYCQAIASNRAAALANEHTPNWDVALYVGADFHALTLDQCRAAVRRSLEVGRLVFAHTHLTHLEESETQDLVSGCHEVAPSGPRHPNTFSGVLAVPRSLWEAVRGFDERFIDWGWEDLAFWASCMAVGRGFERIDADIYHLWHPRSWEENEGNPHHAANMVLGQRYLAVKSQRAAMLRLIRERP